MANDFEIPRVFFMHLAQSIELLVESRYRTLGSTNQNFEFLGKQHSDEFL